MKISVAIATYNGEKYLEKQLDSILKQDTIIVDEIVVCDDISNDKTIEILDKHSHLYPNVFKVYQNENNLGSNKNFEKAISLCTGDFIFLADQDDIWKNDKIKKILDVFENNKTAEGVFSNADIIDDNDKLIHTKTIWDSVFFFEKELPKPIDFFDLISKNGNVVTGATLCIKKSVKDFIFPFPEGMLHDQWIASYLALKNVLYYSNENLISYRLHNNQQVGMKNINKIKKKERLKRIILNLETPKTYQEYRFLSKKIYLKHCNCIKFNELLSSNLNLSSIVIESKNDWNEINSTIKSKFPIKFALFNFIDGLRRKRNI